MKFRAERILSNKKKQKFLIRLTFVMFLLLAAETVFSGTVAIYEQGATHLEFHLSLPKIMSILVYLSAAILIITRVSYKILLLPDFVLLALKLYNVFSGVLMLRTVDSEDFSLRLDILEKVTESGLFALFLLCLFSAKLLHLPEFVHEKLPYICFFSLILCFPFTVIFEIVKCTEKTLLHSLPLSASLFNLTLGIVSEALLDLPYALMLLIIFYIPQKKMNENI